jgi:hypothetical protein
MSNIVELRQYTLKPGQRDTLIELFEREFIESQEVLGMDVIGTFCDADDPDRFVWLRGFPDMERRTQSLAAFYGGPVWKAHRQAANATILDSDNVLLLRPGWDDAGFPGEGTHAPRNPPTGFVTASICHFDRSVPDAFVRTFHAAIPALFGESEEACFLGAFVTEPSANTFPALPVREGENVFVWFARVRNPGASRTTHLPADVECAPARPPEILRLLPTARSRLR